MRGAAKERKTRNPHNHPTKQKIRKNTFSYEKIPQLNESTTPTTKRRPKNTSPKKGRGGHTSIREYQPIQQKEPEKRSSTIRFQSKTQASPRKTQTRTTETQHHIEGGGGGHVSEREEPPNSLKEPEKRSESIRFSTKTCS